MTLKQLLRMKYLRDLSIRMTALEMREYRTYERLLLDSTTIDFYASMDTVIQESIDYLINNKIDEALDDT